MEAFFLRYMRHLREMWRWLLLLLKNDGGSDALNSLIVSNTYDDHVENRGTSKQCVFDFWSIKSET
jgi:hypothetical protein